MDKNTPQDGASSKDAATQIDSPGSSRREFLGQSGRVAAGVGVAALLGNLGQYALSYGAGGPPIKIGILHSLSGTMAISEVSLRDVVLMAVEEINKAGGVWGGRSRRRSSIRRRIGTCLPRKPSSCCWKTKCRWCSAAGRR